MVLRQKRREACSDSSLGNNSNLGERGRESEGEREEKRES